MIFDRSSRSYAHRLSWFLFLKASFKFNKNIRWQQRCRSWVAIVWRKRHLFGNKIKLQKRFVRKCGMNCTFVPGNEIWPETYPFIDWTLNPKILPLQRLSHDEVCKHLLSVKPTVDTRSLWPWPLTQKSSDKYDYHTSVYMSIDNLKPETFSIMQLKGI